MPDLSELLELASTDPLFFYCLVASLFLAAVALVSGWRRGDFLAVIRPKGLILLSLGVFTAFVLLLLSQSLGDALPSHGPAGKLSWHASLGGISRLPLYVLALAYGPSAGLLAAALFAAFAATTPLPSWSEAVLALELVVLGWFAIAPSPRTFRWAGPFGAVLAYLLAWSTGGTALLQHLTGDGANWTTHLLYHQAVLGGVGLSLLALWFVGPDMYASFFSGSRIAPGKRARSGVRTQTNLPHPERELVKPILPALEEGTGRQRAKLEGPQLPPLDKQQRGNRVLEPVRLEPSYFDG